MEEDLRRLSPSLELRTVAGMGRGVFTKVPISAGDTIFSELPIAHCSVEETRGTICEHCFNRSESLKKCSRCKFVYYYNSDCQRLDWPLHKTECEGVSGLSRTRAAPFVRLVLRALTRDTQHLCSLPVDWFDRRVEQNLIRMITRLCDYPLHVIDQLFLKLICNHFSIISDVDNTSEVGEAVYSAPSLLNHSCRPNTLPLFNGRQLVLKAVRDIGPDEQLFITYIETLELLSERQTRLQKRYNFTCACERCLEDISKSPGCSEQLLLMAADGREIPGPLRQEMEEKLAELDGLQKCEDKWQEVYDKGRVLYTSHLTQLSHDNILWQRLMEHLSNVSIKLSHFLNNMEAPSRIDMSRLKEALKYKIELLEPRCRHYGPLHPDSAIQLMTIASMGRSLYLGTCDQKILRSSLYYHAEARKVALRLYGADHPITRGIASMLIDLTLNYK